MTVRSAAAWYRAERSTPGTVPLDVPVYDDHPMGWFMRNAPDRGPEDLDDPIYPKETSHAHRR